MPVRLSSESLWRETQAHVSAEHGKMDVSCYLQTSPRLDDIMISPRHKDSGTCKNAETLQKGSLIRADGVPANVAACQAWLTSCHLDCSPKIDDVSTTIGSDTSEACWDDNSEELQGACSSQGESTEDEEEEGAKEEAEFSLDGRLATLKRWRRFQALRAETGACTAITIAEVLPAAVAASPSKGFDAEVSLRKMAMTPDAHSPGHSFSADTTPTLAPPPGLSGMHFAAAVIQPLSPSPVPLEPHFNLLNMKSSLLMQTGMPGLEQHIRLLSQRALHEDTWDALLKPEPGDPEWQLLALVGKDCLAGFSTYTFFQEDRDDGSEGLIMSVHHVVIDEALRGMGHGRTMLKDLLSRAHVANAWSVKLYSAPSAVGFYERIGFKQVGPDNLMEVRLLQ